MSIASNVLFTVYVPPPPKIKAAFIEAYRLLKTNACEPTVPRDTAVAELDHPSLFIIKEENSKYEESRIGSNLNFDYSKIESIKDN